MCIGFELTCVDAYAVGLLFLFFLASHIPDIPQLI